MPDSVNTQGGASFDKDVHAARDVIGRDQIINNIYNAARDYTRSAWHMLSPISEKFVGRADEIERVLALSRQPNLRDGAIALTSLTGMGGIGKTALANVVAHALRKDFPDGELIFELKGHSLAPRAPEQELDLVLRKLLDVPFEAKLPGDLPTLRRLYLDALHGKRCVVIIDDAQTDGEVDALLPPSGCVALITSRRQLARGQRVPVKKLSRAESVAVLRGYRQTLSDADADAIASACADHPLALNVAGAYLSRRETTSAERYLQALGQDRLKTFSAGLDDDDETRNIFAVFGYSFWSLNDEQQAAWLALSVMPAPFDRAAGVAVCGAGEDGLEHPLDTLVEYNLLEYDPATQRFAWHDLLKEFASNRQKDEAQREAAKRRHAAYFTQVAYAARELYEQGGENVVRGLVLFDRERAHFEAAFDILRALNAHRELIDLVDAVVYTGQELRFHPSQQIDWLEAQRDFARASGHKQAEGTALGNLGNAYHSLGDANRAIEYYQQALAIDREIGDRRGEGTSLGNLGLAYADLGDASRAIEYYEQRLVIAREIGDRRGEGAGLGNLGNAHVALGDAQWAIEFYEQYLAIAREIGDRRGEGNALGNLGATYYSLGDARRAIEFYEQHLVIAREIGDRRGEGNALGNLGAAYAALGDARRAIEFYEQALVIDREIGDRRGEGADLGNLGNAYADLGDAPLAMEHYTQLLTIAREMGDRRLEDAALGSLGNTHVELGDARRAIGFYEQALVIDREIGDRRGEGADLGNLGNAYADLGDARRAIGFYEQALVIKREIGDRQGEAKTSWNLGVVYESQGDLARAVELMQVYADFLREIAHPDADKRAAYVAAIRAKMSP